MNESKIIAHVKDSRSVKYSPQLLTNKGNFLWYIELLTPMIMNSLLGIHETPTIINAIKATPPFPSRRMPFLLRKLPDRETQLRVKGFESICLGIISNSIEQLVHIELSVPIAKIHQAVSLCHEVPPLRRLPRLGPSDL